MKFKYLHTLPKAIAEEVKDIQEFRQDAAIVSLELMNGQVFSNVLFVHPNFIASVKGYNTIPFNTEDVVKMFQTEENINTRSDSSWEFYMKSE